MCGGLIFFFNQMHPQTKMGTSRKRTNVFKTIFQNKDTQTTPQHLLKMDFNLFEPYDGDQTVDDLLDAFSWVAAYPVIDEKYPPQEWLKILLEKGIVIENYSDYSGYMAARASLVELENQPEMWTSDIFGLPPTNDWETFKSAFIERKIWEYEQFRAAIQVDPEVDGGFFTGTDKRTFLPAKPGRVYVKRKESGIVLIGEKLDDTKADSLFYEGTHPEGYEIIYIDDNGVCLTEDSLPILHDEDEFAINTQSLQEAIPIETQKTEGACQLMELRLKKN